MPAFCNLVLPETNQPVNNSRPFTDQYTATDVDGESSGNDDDTSVQLNVSKSWGKQHAILLSDSDDQELESPEKLSTSRATSLSFSEISIPLPPTDSEYASLSTASMVELAEGSELDHELVNSHLTEPSST
jgi:hypothetical protein